MFNVIIINAPTNKKRLMIHIKAAKEPYNDYIIKDIIWLRRECNHAHSINKPLIMPKLIDTLKESKLHPKVEQYITREIRSEQEEKTSYCKNVTKYTYALNNKTRQMDGIRYERHKHVSMRGQTSIQ